MARRFFYVTMGILALAGAYHLGAARTDAQSGGPFVSITGVGNDVSNSVFAITSTGDLYSKEQEFWYYIGNFIIETGGPVSVDPSSLGAIKGSYR